MKEVNGQRFILIQYSRPGLNGADRVVQYEFPDGLIMYRLIGVAPAAQFSKYQPTFAHVASSLKINPREP